MSPRATQPADDMRKTSSCANGSASGTVALYDGHMTSFAVVVPLYNKRPHIARALDSIFGQTEAPAEIFVVDDASTDGGLDEVVRHRDERLKILRRSEPGPGGYAARNMAVLRAQSDWI